MILSNYTILMTLAFLHLVLPLNTWVALSGQRSRAVQYWCASGALGGLAAVTGMLAPFLPEALVYRLIPWAVFASANIHLHNVLADTARERSPREIPPLILGFVLLTEGLGLAAGENAQIALQGALILAVLTALVAAAWQGVRLRRDRATLRLAVSYTVYLALALAAGLMWAAGWQMALELDSPGMTVLLLIAVFAVISGNFSFIRGRLETNLDARLQDVQATAAAAEATALTQQLARLDRQRTVGFLAASLEAQLIAPISRMSDAAARAETSETSGTPDPDDLYRTLDEIVAANRAASELTAKIRQFIRPAPMQITDVHPRAVLRDAAQFIGPEIRERGIHLQLDAVDETLQCKADERLLYQVILNVLRNAMEAMEHSPMRELRLGSSCTEGRVNISICDTGPGFSNAALAAAGWQKYSSKAAGLGLGLNIARKILRGFDAHLVLANRPEGGARVDIDLPAGGPVA
jgi:C4-dicarboxylate-specific signal transduction histidine kinase